MNFYKNLSVFMNDRNNQMIDGTRAIQAETDRFKSIFKILDIEQFNSVFQTALDEYWGNDYSNVDKQDEAEFLKVLKKLYINTNVIFQVKDAEEFDFVFESGKLIEIKTTRYKVLKESLINALEMDEFSNGSYYIEKLLRAIRKKIKNEQKEAS